MVDSKVVKEEERISFKSIVAQTWRRTFFFLIAQETMTNLQKFLPPDQKPGMINTETSLEFIRSCEDFCWNHDKSTPCRSETNEIAESAVRRKKEYLFSSVSVGSSEKWWEKTMECFCYLRNKQGQLIDRKSPCERRFGTPFDGPVIPFGASFFFEKDNSHQNK